MKTDEKEETNLTIVQTNIEPQKGKELQYPSFLRRLHHTL